MNEIFNCDCIELIKNGYLKDKNICIVTDPPFNIGYHYKSYKDKLKNDEYYELLKNVLVTYDVPFVVIHYAEQLHELSIRLGIAPQKVISWVYNSNTAKQHRDIAFYKVKPNFNLVKQPYKNPNDKRIKERIARGITGSKLYDWWNINQVKNVRKGKNGINHPCVMPLEVMKNIVGILPKGKVIVDPFMGSGTTGVACKELGYDFIGIELDENYFKIAKERINNA